MRSPQPGHQITGGQITGLRTTTDVHNRTHPSHFHLAEAYHVAQRYAHKKEIKKMRLVLQIST
jgi:hypothetical protein